MADIIDLAQERDEKFQEHSRYEHSKKLKPEQVQNPDGSWPITECVDCGIDIPEGRLNMGKVRCVDCQAALEHRRKLHG